MSGQRFRLQMNIRIEQLDEHGHSHGGWGQPITLEENLTLGAGSFLEIAHTLGQFHELAQQIKARPE